MSLNFHDPGKLTPYQFYDWYEMPLARAFYAINQRGIMTDSVKLEELRSFVTKEIEDCVQRCSAQLGQKVIAQAPDGPKNKAQQAALAGTLNLSSPKQLADILRKANVKIPKKRRPGGAYTESLDEESLNELYAETGNPFLKELLRIRELNKMLGTYVNVDLEAGIFYSAYFVTGTVTGRRSSRENFLGLGSNGQNKPKHSDLGKRFLECFKARPGRIFVNCDQVQAEDWIVSGLIADIGGDRTGLDELLNKVDRHRRLAAFLFSKPEAECGKDTQYRFMGKKTRHAGNYDMRAFRFAAEMAKEGFLVKEDFCEWLLTKFHQANPGIKKIFHKYVQDELTQKRQLITPFGRLRQFFSLRDYSDNSKVFKEGYAQIPQSTVGDNTGMAVLWMENFRPGLVVADGHDSVTLEVRDTISSVIDAVSWLNEAFNRIVRFPNGLEIIIPIEFEIGYNLKDLISCKATDETSLTTTYQMLPRPQSPLRASTCGQPSPSSPERSSDTSGSSMGQEPSIPISTQS